MAIETTDRTASTTEVIEGLNDLLQLDHDAIGSYEIAIQKLEDREHAGQIAGFLRDHQRHVETLSALILGLGGTPKNEPHATAPLKNAMQGLGAVAGDKGILMAWRTNELQVRTKYDGYASKAVFWPNDVKRAIDENALDEERHYEWVVQVLERMGVSSGEGNPIVTKAREGMAQLGDATANVREQVRDRATSAMDDARSRVSDGRERADEMRRNLEREVQESPFRSVLATFAIGFVIGRLLR